MSEQQVVNLWALSDLCTPWCLHVAATLRIAEHIDAGKNQVGDLALAASADPYALHRVITHLVGKGVFEEPSPGCFKLNQSARHCSIRGSGSGSTSRALAAEWPTRGAHCWDMCEPVHLRTTSVSACRSGKIWTPTPLGASFDALMGPAGHGAPSVEFGITVAGLPCAPWSM